MIHEISAYAVLVFAALFPIMNPPAAALMLLSMTEHESASNRRQIARRTVLYGFMILVVVVFLGRGIIDFFGLSLSAIRVAGGIVVGLIGGQMLFPSPAPAEAQPRARGGDIALVPLAMPGLTGPGSIAAVIGIAARVPHDRIWTGTALVILGIGIVCIATLLIFLITLRSATWITRERAEAMSRIMGFLLIAIGAEFVLSGTKSYFFGEG